jgi:hypothetical protein
MASANGLGKLPGVPHATAPGSLRSRFAGVVLSLVFLGFVLLFCNEALDPIGVRVFL